MQWPDMPAVARRAPRTTEHRWQWRRPVLPTGTGGTLGKKGLKKWETGRSGGIKASTRGWHLDSTGDRHSVRLHTGSSAASQEEAVFVQCNELLTRSYLLALAVAGHLGQQFLLFPGEGKGTCARIRTHPPDETVKYAFFSLSLFFSKQLSWLSLLPVSSYLLCSAHLLQTTSVFHCLCRKKPRWFMGSPPPQGFSGSSLVDGVVVVSVTCGCRDAPVRFFSFVWKGRIRCRYRMMDFVFPVHEHWYTWQRAGYFTGSCFMSIALRKKKILKKE